MRSYFSTYINWVVITSFICSSLLIAGCNHQDNEETQLSPPEVEVEHVSLNRVQLWDYYNGRIAAIDSIEIRPRVTGYIDRIGFKEGAMVEKDSPLFFIDPRPYRAALKSALAKLEKAIETRDLAKDQTRRAQFLIKNNAISHEEFDTRESELVKGQADVNAAEAAVVNAKLNLDFTEIRTPITGHVGRALLSLGNLAIADQSILTTIVSQDPIYVYFECNEKSYLGYLTKKNKMSPKIEGKSIYIALASDEEFYYSAKIDFSDNQINSETGTIKLRAVLMNPDNRFVPGSYARVKFPSGDPINTITIDEKAIQTDQDRNYVYVVDKNNTAIRKDVLVGRSIGHRKIVLHGLTVGDKVVIDGAQKILFPGMPVKPAQKLSLTLSNSAHKK